MRAIKSIAQLSPPVELVYDVAKQGDSCKRPSMTHEHFFLPQHSVTSFTIIPLLKTSFALSLLYDNYT